MKVLELIGCLSIIITCWTGLTGAGWIEINGTGVWHDQAGILQSVMQQGDGLIVLPFSDITKTDLSNSMFGSKKNNCSVTEGTPLPQEWARGGHMAGIVEGCVIVAGGNNWSKDKTTKYWLKKFCAYSAMANGCRGPTCQNHWLIPCMRMMTADYLLLEGPAMGHRSPVMFTI